MVAEAAAAVTETSDSPVGTPPSESPPSSLSARPDASPESSGVETPGSGGDEKPVALPPEASRTLEDYESYRKAKGVLTDAEIDHRDQLVARKAQADSDRARAQQERVTAWENAQQARATEWSGAKDKLTSATKAEVRRTAERFLNGDIDLFMEFLEPVLDRNIEDYHAKAGEVHAGPVEYELRNWLWNCGVYAKDEATARALNGMGPAELARQIAEAGHYIGKSTGPDDDHMVVTKAAYKKLQDQVDRRAADDDKSANPVTVSPSITTSQPGGRTAYGAMTYEQRRALSPAERDRLVAESLRQ